MTTPLLIAGGLSLLLALVHSYLGERLIFARIVKGGLWTPTAIALLPARRWVTLRSTWHLVSLLGCGMGLMLVAMAVPQDNSYRTLEGVLCGTFAVCAAYWLLGTSGRHPAWIVMLVIAGLTLAAI